MTVSAILQAKGREVFCEPCDRTVGEVCATLGARGIGAMVLHDGDKEIAGIVSERDVVRAIALNGRDILEQPVRDIMTRKVMVCEEQDTLLVVLARMTEGRFRHLPVVKDGRLSGIISIGDVVKYRIAQVEREAEEMRSYIHAG
ncbi:CBS domain-containing protein [Polycladidibacter hongkongensis]|uniref:CBS domain-containing protein n=1 Tax=Polycladidibacter hongkongensis TaxID=1647556 RepID=UPI0008338ABA|nr:CBS domain-containing protein [Pseudovibrio hongkongensis]